MGKLWFFYLTLSITIKIYLITINFSYDLIPSLPYFFLSSIIMSTIIFLLLDFPVLKLHGLVKKITAVFVSLAFFTIVMVTMLNVKLYLTIGSFLTYELFQQVKDLSVFRESIIQEMDPLAVILAISGIFYTILSLYAGRLGRFRYKIPVVITAAAVILVSSSALYSRNNKTEFHSIDRDPIIELTSSAIVNEKENYKTVTESRVKMKPASAELKNFSAAKPGCAKGMNVVFFILESTTPRYLSPEVTPNITALSENALVLNSHYTTEPATMKAVYSLMTGRLPYVSRNWWQFLKTSEKDVSFAQVLSGAGYYTEFAMPVDGKEYYEKDFLKPHFSKVSDGPDIKALYPFCRSTSMGYEDNTLVWYMESFLKLHSKEKFLLTLSSVNPHHPYDVSSKSYEIFGKATTFEMYKNALHGADDVIGKCYSLLVKYGLEKNTLFVLVSDHGEAFYQHRRNYLHSIYLYDENVHTVAMIINPVIFPKKIQYNHVTSHLDIGPTILDFTGTPYGNLNPEGISLFTYAARQAVFFTSFSIPYWGCRVDKYKYILNRRYNTEELYNLETDPDEKNNIAETNPDICKKLNTYHE